MQKTDKENQPVRQPIGASKPTKVMIDGRTYAPGNYIVIKAKADTHHKLPSDYSNILGAVRSPKSILTCSQGSMQSIVDSSEFVINRKKMEVKQFTKVEVPVQRERSGALKQKNSLDKYFEDETFAEIGEEGEINSRVEDKINASFSQS